MTTPSSIGLDGQHRFGAVGRQLGVKGPSNGYWQSRQALDRRKRLKNKKGTMIQKILEHCQKGSHGVGFNEVVLMLYNSVATAEVSMDMDDIRFTDDGSTVTFMAENGTHLHMKLDQVKELRFQYTERNERGEPSYSVWFLDENQESVLRIYLRKSEAEATNQPRHELFMELLETYGESLRLTS
jgi:hypothetical protein